MTTTVRSATASDARDIAALHADSWRSSYRGILTDEFLDGPVLEERLRLWTARLAAPATGQMFVGMVRSGYELHGFVCAVLDHDPEWGALLDNIHVRPAMRGKGLGRVLMAQAAGWVMRQQPHSRLHLWVYAQNVDARRFYERLGAEVTGSCIHNAPDSSTAPAIHYGWTDLMKLIERCQQDSVRER